MTNMDNVNGNFVADMYATAYMRDYDTNGNKVADIHADSLGIIEYNVRTQIGSELNVNELRIIVNLCERWLETAKEACNRDDTPLSMLHIVADTVVAAYNKLGNEGMVSESAGVQNVSYDDLYNSMHKRLLNANLRVYRI